MAKYSSAIQIVGLGGYWNINEYLDVSVGLDLYYPNAGNYEDNSNWAIGADYETANGTLSGAISGFPTWDATTGAAENLGQIAEVYYNIPINDSVSIKPAIMKTFVQSDNTNGTIYSIDTIFTF